MTTTHDPIHPTIAPTIATGFGKLRGTVENGLQVFRGIPFAKPPTGDLRFRAPERPEPWSGVRDATCFGPASYQVDRPIARMIGMILPEQSEDCLTLNVWTPSPAVGGGGRRPVMVWIHGGAWVIGSGREATYDGSSLAGRGDVVVVTINYRLGAFGFLSSPELGATGNEGILDCMAALEWVRDEIAAFGGDPTNVTVFGESAGSVNIACLLATKRARGLFHKAVLQSGAPNLLRSPDTAASSTRTMLAQLGLEPGDAGKLRALPAERLLAAANVLAGRTLLPPFAPVADGELIAEKPFAAIGAGSAQGVPLLVGTNEDEMKLYRLLDPALESMDDSALLARASMLFSGGKAKRLVDAYREARKARGADTSPAEIWFAISTDSFFRAPAMKLAELHAAHTPEVFVYQFSWQAKTPGKPEGAIHALDLPFVFGTLDSSEIGAIAGRTPAAHQLSRAMQEAWISFARTGRPQSSALPDWPPYAPPRRATLELGESSKLALAPMETERALWDEVFAFA